MPGIDKRTANKTNNNPCPHRAFILVWEDTTKKLEGNTHYGGRIKLERRTGGTGVGWGEGCNVNRDSGSLVRERRVDKN